MDIVVQHGQQNQALKMKRQVRVFYCDTVHLSLSELVVYSYRAYQDEYARQPLHRKQVARAVGLSADTVSRADQELMRLGLLDGGLRPQRPREDLFRRKGESDGMRHWRHSLLSWTLFVRSAKCGLSPLSMAVWSYVVHCAQTHWQPRGGFGASYLATVLRASRAAPQRVLGQLELSGLLVRRDGCWCPVASKDYSWLADRWSGTTGAASRPSWQELPEVQEQVIPSPSYAKTSMANYSGNGKSHEEYEGDLRRWLLKEVGSDDLLTDITALPEWQTDPRTVYLDAYNALNRVWSSCKADNAKALLAWVGACRSTQGATPSTQSATPTDARRNTA
jgi:hypothetical protein